MNLIRDKVKRVLSFTTRTEADIDVKRDTASSFSVQNAIDAQVQREDYARWFASPELPFAIMPELPCEPPTKLSLYTFIAGILP